MGWQKDLMQFIYLELDEIEIVILRKQIGNLHQKVPVTSLVNITSIVHLRIH